ncbi:hypothetical protein BU16DRAFT_72366 [Lophium mytilinum]|uniref:Uncharacterized protein n=1 Tax=Lophium mytilinum TaxID=390894 RepID=A0A6A6QN24_9PEZI|nr:hypothetical protein BU16DRAFT_72366 [Lophium mytilinum]
MRSARRAEGGHESDFFALPRPAGDIVKRQKRYPYQIGSIGSSCPYSGATSALHAPPNLASHPPSQKDPPAVPPPTCHTRHFKPLATWQKLPCPRQACPPTHRTLSTPENEILGSCFRTPALQGVHAIRLLGAASAVADALSDDSAGPHWLSDIGVTWGSAPSCLQRMNSNDNAVESVKCGHHGMICYIHGNNHIGTFLKFSLTQVVKSDDDEMM